MKKIILISAVFFLFAVTAKAQCVSAPDDPCLSINQSSVNKAAKAVDELKAARDVIAKFQVSDAAFQAERAAAQALVKGLNDLMATKDLITAEYVKINALYKQVIDFQQMIIERLEKQLMKPKSGWQKFADALKTVGYILSGIAIGTLL